MEFVGQIHWHLCEYDIVDVYILLRIKRYSLFSYGRPTRLVYYKRMEFVAVLQASFFSLLEGKETPIRGLFWIVWNGVRVASFHHSWLKIIWQRITSIEERRKVARELIFDEECNLSTSFNMIPWYPDMRYLSFSLSRLEKSNKDWKIGKMDVPPRTSTHFLHLSQSRVKYQRGNIRKKKKSQNCLSFTWHPH